MSWKTGPFLGAEYHVEMRDGERDGMEVKCVNEGRKEGKKERDGMEEKRVNEGRKGGQKRERDGMEEKWVNEGRKEGKKVHKRRELKRKTEIKWKEMRGDTEKGKN